ncbi:unnamed protein product [Schistosoma curassoni]|uniref:Uncharacterized protein n=1 Tax=Schistosoma curassoni TaxID=6186 RepID=A0A183K163_9TREM|nr:unnamed protein product [Schistosoma curassoni]
MLELSDSHTGCLMRLVSEVKILGLLSFSDSLLFPFLVDILKPLNASSNIS